MYRNMHFLLELLAYRVAQMGLEREEIWWWVRGTALTVAALTFLAIIRFGAHHPEKKVLKACEELSGFLCEKTKEGAWYQKAAIWLCRKGAEFHYGSWVNPMRFLLLRLIITLLGLLVFGSLSFGYGVGAAVLLFFLPGWLLDYLNKQDNNRLLPEIKLIYHSLQIQIKAGVYVMDALAECYGSVQEKRLQSALLDLAGDIVMKADIYEALEHFQGRFDNRYIDSLCITILQACESGQAVEILGDIGEQLKDMEAVVLAGKKSSLDRSITFYQLGILAAVLGVVVYACVTHMFQSATFF